MRYTVKPSNDLLQHDNEGVASLGVFSIISDPETDPESDHVDCAEGSWTGNIDQIDCQRMRTLRMISSASKEYKPVKGLFVALGWLSEYDRTEQASRGRTTYYLVLLNLSTKPKSLLLMYDYHVEAYLEDWVCWTNRLGNYYQDDLSDKEAEHFRQESQEVFRSYEGLSVPRLNLKGHASRIQDTTFRFIRAEPPPTEMEPWLATVERVLKNDVDSREEVIAVLSGLWDVAKPGKTYLRWSDWTFSGSLHCAAMISCRNIKRCTDQSKPERSRSSKIGVSKQCCMVCSLLLDGVQNHSHPTSYDGATRPGMALYRTSRLPHRDRMPHL